MKKPAWRQADLAERVGCDPSDIGKYERGERIPTLCIAWRIAGALDRPMHEVFWGCYEKAHFGDAMGVPSKCF